MLIPSCSSYSYNQHMDWRQKKVFISTDSTVLEDDYMTSDVYCMNYRSHVLLFLGTYICGLYLFML